MYKEKLQNKITEGFINNEINTNQYIELKFLKI